VNEQEIISKAILSTYDIRNDDMLFRNNPYDFEQLRGDYPTRREFPAYSVKDDNVNKETLRALKELGFKVS